MTNQLTAREEAEIRRAAVIAFPAPARINAGYLNYPTVELAQEGRSPKDIVEEAVANGDIERRFCVHVEFPNGHYLNFQLPELFEEPWEVVRDDYFAAIAPFATVDAPGAGGA